MSELFERGPLVGDRLKERAQEMADEHRLITQELEAIAKTGLCNHPLKGSVLRNVYFCRVCKKDSVPR